MAFNDDDPTSIDWYSGGFVDLAIYYGFQTSTTKVAGAPEECTFLIVSPPCIGQRHIYGVPWSILRWMSDQLGPGFTGGEKGLQKAITNSSSVGYANLAGVAGVSMDTILAQWAAMLYVDDRVVGAATRLTLPSWNLVSIESGLVVPARLVPRDHAYADYADNFNVRAGSSAYFKVTGATHAATAVRARTPAGGTLPANIQVWVVRMQ